MLDLNVKQQNIDKLTFVKEVIAATAKTHPVDSMRGVVFDRDIASIFQDKSSIPFHANSLIGRRFIPEDPENSLEDNFLMSAKNDLLKNPDNPFLLCNYAQALVSSSEIDEAFKYFTKAIERKPDLKIASLHLAYLHLVRNNDDEAEKIYNSILKTNSNDTLTLLNLGNLYIKKKQLNEAKNIFNKVIKLDKNNTQARERIAIINIIEGDIYSSISELRKCIRIETSSPYLYNNLGIAHVINKSNDKAELAFKTSIKISPTFKYAIRNLANLYRMTGRIEQSIMVLESYLEKREDIKTKELLARLFVENNQEQKSLKILKALLSKSHTQLLNNEEIVRLNNNIGVIYHSLFEYDNAILYYQKSIESGGFVNPINLYNILDLYFDLSDLSKVKEYLEILKQNFKDDIIYNFYSGKYSLYTEEIDKSVESLERLIKKYKKFGPAYTLLSFVYIEYKNLYERSIEVCKEGLKHFPGDVPILNNLAYTYIQSNKFDDAQSILDEVQGVNDNIFINATRGLLKFKEGKIEEGTRLYNLASRLAAINPILSDMIIQKKFLELTKYYYDKGMVERARSSIMNIIRTKFNNTIYFKQAELLLEKYNL